jgi:chromatin structure-remodeling complex subunit RSC1/2
MTEMHPRSQYLSSALLINAFFLITTKWLRSQSLSAPSEYVAAPTAKTDIIANILQGKILKKEYKRWKEYVADFAQIVHNAQVYNRPSAPVFSDANKLRELMKLEFAKLVQQGVITAEEAEMPDLGPLPEFEDSPPPPPGQEQPPSDDEPEEEEEEEEDEEDDDDSDNEGKRKKKRGPRTPATAKREGKQDGTQDDAVHKKRGRPPKVFTPMEARINNILKGLRRPKDKNNDLMVLHFEKVPDKSLYPEYHQMFPNPIALDIIKRKAKRKKYSSVDAVMKDVELMFENAKAYNQDGSEIWECAVHLQQEARKLAEQEKAKPDSAYVDDDGRLPLAEILHNGEVWKVGDWVHLQNPNDLNKPIVAQIYRTWQDADGQKWINACWYYRPEQTVHSFEKHFLENEVMKTGQYRDHHVDEIVDRCFVMFVTRFFKGRPRGFPADKEVYVCEARYNEENCKINKIKTWASCVPDEVREKDYEMDLFDMPRKMKKYPSPIKHLLRDDAKPDDPLPKPTWGSPNAPPIVGAVHRRPREANVSENHSKPHMHGR